MIILSCNLLCARESVSLDCEFFNQALRRSKSYNVRLKTDTFETLKTLNEWVLRI